MLTTLIFSQFTFAEAFAARHFKNTEHADHFYFRLS